MKTFYNHLIPVPLEMIFTIAGSNDTTLQWALSEPYRLVGVTNYAGQLLLPADGPTDYIVPGGMQGIAALPTLSRAGDLQSFVFRTDNLRFAVVVTESTLPPVFPHYTPPVPYVAPAPPPAPVGTGFNVDGYDQVDSTTVHVRSTEPKDYVFTSNFGPITDANYYDKVDAQFGRADGAFLGKDGYKPDWTGTLQPSGSI